jgi:hypothetical protein
VKSRGASVEWLGHWDQPCPAWSSRSYSLGTWLQSHVARVLCDCHLLQGTEAGAHGTALQRAQQAVLGALAVPHFWPHAHLLSRLLILRPATTSSTADHMVFPC